MPNKVKQTLSQKSSELKKHLKKQPFTCDSCRFWETRKTHDNNGYCYKIERSKFGSSEICSYSSDFDHSIAEYNWDIQIKGIPVVEPHIIQTKLNF